MAECRSDLLWVDHQDGKLGYFLNEDGEAVLCDYIGNASILYLPSSLGHGCDFVDVSSTIPDESFHNCKNVKLILVDCRYNKRIFGYFVFINCSGLLGKVDLNEYYWDEDEGVRNGRSNGSSFYDEYSFTNEDYTPRRIVDETMCFDSGDFARGTVKKFFQEVISNNLIDELLEVIKHSEYLGYTGMDFDSYDNPRVIDHFKQKGVNPSSLAIIGRCWNKVKQKWL